MRPDQRFGRGGLVGRTRTVSSRNPGTSLPRAGSISASAKRIRAAQAEDSATTVSFPLSREQRFTLFASSGPKASITATCHSDASAVAGAPLTRIGRRAEIKSPTDLGGNPWRTLCLSRRGVFGIVSRLLGLECIAVKRLDGAMTTGFPAGCKSLKLLGSPIRTATSMATGISGRVVLERAG